MRNSSRHGRPRLYAEHFAPWCEKARWALDFYGIDYDYYEHTPLLGELALRIASGRWRGRVTVPLLVGDGAAIMSSLEIAEYAARKTGTTELFPQRGSEQIVQWDRRSEALMVAGRALLLPRILESQSALREQLPPAVPAALQPALTWMATVGVHFLMDKYQTRSTRSADDDASRRVLDELRAALAAEADGLVGGQFSFADIAMASALQFVKPVAADYIALRPATRDAWTNHKLAGEYADLLAWRDALYARERRRRRDPG